MSPFSPHHKMAEKRINVSPEFLRVASNTRRKGSSKPGRRTTSNPDRIRSKLMARIKTFQDRQQRQNKKKQKPAMSIETETEAGKSSSFEDSVRFLENLSKEKVQGKATNSSDPRDPPYGCLKGGRKQTYRQWKAKQGTVRNQIGHTNPAPTPAP